MAYWYRNQNCNCNSPTFRHTFDAERPALPAALLENGHGFPCGRPLSKRGAARNGRLMPVGCGSLPAEMWWSEGDLLRGEKLSRKNIPKERCVLHLSNPTVLLDMLWFSIKEHNKYHIVSYFKTFIRGTLCALAHVVRMLRVKHGNRSNSRPNWLWQIESTW